MLALAGCPKPVDPGVPFEAEGTWVVEASTFPMWLDGRRSCPTFRYDPRADGKIDDTVRFVRRDREPAIRGVDRRLGPGAFAWRGKGLLGIATSRWTVRHVEEEWAVLTFAPTLFTPAGLDVIRAEDAPPVDREAAAVVVESLGLSQPSWLATCP